MGVVDGVVGMVVRGCDLHDVRGDQRGVQSDPPDGAQQVRGGHSARFRRPGAGCEAGIEHVDVHGQVQRPAAVHGPGDRVGDDRA